MVDCGAFHKPMVAGPSEAVRHGGGCCTKNLQGERERKGREGRKEKEKRRKKRDGRKRKEMARRAREKDVGLLRLCRCKTPP